MGILLAIIPISLHWMLQWKRNDLYAVSNRQAHAAAPHYSTPWAGRWGGGRTKSVDFPSHWPQLAMHFHFFPNKNKKHKLLLSTRRGVQQRRHAAKSDNVNSPPLASCVMRVNGRPDQIVKYLFVQIKVSRDWRLKLTGSVNGWRWWLVSL